MNRLITTLFCLLLVSLPAHAQHRELKPGINYTTLAKPKTVKPAKAVPAKETPIKNVQGEKAPAEKSQDPATVVWNKYKELATGQTQEQKEMEKGPQMPKAPEKPSIDNPAAKSVNHKSDVKTQPSSFATILQEWKNSKDRKKEMRSKSFKVPKQAVQQTP